VAILSDADVRRVLDTAYQHDPDFGALVMILAATGCRFDQAARIRVADFQPEAGRVMVPVSRKGRGAKQIPYAAVPLPDDVVKRLRPLVAGRAGHEPLLMRWHHKQVAGDAKAGTLPRWERDGRRAWLVAADMTRAWKATIAAAGLPAGTVPYALRHSSIVRGLRAGLPARLVAAAHDTSTAMIEKHYSAFIMDAAGDLLRRAMLPLAPAEVVQLRHAAAG
jgi:integrase